MVVESVVVGQRERMTRDNDAALGGEIADRIAGLQAEELNRFLRIHLRQRDLHRVVANLNAAALSKRAPVAGNAQAALRRLGFTD